MKKYKSIFLFGIACIAALFFYRSAIAQGLWNYFHIAQPIFVLNHSDPNLFLQIGNFYFGGGAYDLDQAERAFKKAIAIDPTLPLAHYQLARVYFIRSDFHFAEKEINTELQLNPDFGRSHYVRGLIYGYSGRLKEAETEFKAFLAWKPESWAGYNDLAWIYFQQGKYPEAHDAALSGLNITPANPWLLNALGVAALNLGDKKEAKVTFMKALGVLYAMKESDWGKAYPGNDPDMYAQGYAQMKGSLEKNLALLHDVDITE